MRKLVRNSQILIRGLGLIVGLFIFFSELYYIASAKHRMETTSGDPAEVAILTLWDYWKGLENLLFSCFLIANFLLPFYKKRDTKFVHFLAISNFAGLSIVSYYVIHITVEIFYQYFLLQIKSWESIPATGTLLVIVLCNWYLSWKEMWGMIEE